MEVEQRRLAELLRAAAKWNSAAACRGMDTEIFFPDPHCPADIAAAIALCGACPMLRLCADWGLAVGVSDGVIGGVFLHGRKKAKQQRARLRMVADGKIWPGQLSAGSTQRARSGTRLKWSAEQRIAATACARNLRSAGKTWPEIGKVLGCHPSTASRLLRRARRDRDRTGAAA